MSAPVLSIENLVVGHKTPHGIVQAVAGVSLEIAPGETLGLVGESGCGKSSLARAVIGLNSFTGGTLSIGDTTLTPKSRRTFSSYVQMVFQNPYGSLNPRKTVFDLVEEPLRVQRIGTKTERAERTRNLLAQVSIPDTMAERLPHQLSGGQRQRVGLARALALEPTLIICDEPVSALDVSVQAQVLNLLMAQQKQRHLAYLFISHDLDVVRYVSHRIAVMYLGTIVETGQAEDLWERPLHPYTKALICGTDLGGTGSKLRKQPPLVGDLPSPLNPPSGCRFRTRCPYAIERCAAEVPAWRQFGKEHYAACHRVEELEAL